MYFFSYKIIFLLDILFLNIYKNINFPLRNFREGGIFLDKTVLDALDNQIIRLLTEDGRMSIGELNKKAQCYSADHSKQDKNTRGKRFIQNIRPG